MLDHLIAELRRAVGPHAVVADADSLRTYDADASMIVAQAPQLVVLPADPAQAAAVVRIAASAGLPVVARGAGTGIAGGAVPVRGGVLLSTARMDRVEAVEPRSRRAVVGPGVVNAELNARLAPLGLQFAPDPSSQRASTIGGNLATNAGGPHCLKYGVTSNHILAVEIVRPDGSLLWTGDGTPDAAGYDLTGLVVGSEGTFGVVTRAMVRLTPLPEANRVVLALFPSVVAASAAVSAVIAAGSLPTSLEVMDHNAIRAVNGAYGLGLPEAEGTTLLIVEVDGVEDGLDEALEEILAACRAHGAFELRPARTAAEQARVWVARKSVAGAIGRLAPAYLLVDTVVPRTRLPLMMEEVERLRREHALEVCNVFHAGDGNLHPLVLYDPRDADQARRAHAIAEGVLELSIAQGGVISGEHGIGLEKQEYLPLLFTPCELQLQAAVYRCFNPADQFNPAKIFPSDRSPRELADERRARILERGSEGQGDKGTRGQGDKGTESLGHGVFEQVLLSLGELVGEGSLVRGEHGVVVAPGSIGELASVVAECHRAGIAVVPTGSRSHPHALTPARPRALISTARLARVLTYEPDDLTIGVEAGMTLAELQALLAQHGQMLPLDRHAPAETTVGALVAAGAEGPRRLGYGTLRDWVLALTVIEADGTVSRLGAQVVKNVTGYDLVKLFVGSRGTLGVIAAVSLKLFPRPPASATCRIALPGRAAAFALLDELAASSLQPTAAEYVEGLPLPGAGSATELLVRAEGREAAVARHLRDLHALAARHGGAAGELRGGEEDGLWAAVVAHAGAPAGADEALIRLCAPPAELRAALDDAALAAAGLGLSLRAGARGLSGVAYLRATGPGDALRELHTRLVALRGHAHLLDAAPAVREGAPIWGAAPPALELMRTLKAELDPSGLMNPGAFLL
jgi:D-lactate dehydrogenase (cytochrome)